MRRIRYCTALVLDWVDSRILRHPSGRLCEFIILLWPDMDNIDNEG